MQKELSLGELFKVLKRTWWKMLLIAIVGMIMAGLYTHYLIPERFSSTVTFYIRNEQTNTDYINPTLLTGTDTLANNYISIIKSDECLTKIQAALEDQGIVMETKAISRMLSFAKETDSSTFRLRVSGTNAYEAYAVANLIDQMAPTIITDIVKPNSEKVIYGTLVDIDGNNDLRDETIGREAAIRVPGTPCVGVLNHPVEDTAPDSPNMMKNMLLVGAIAAVLTYCIALLISLMDTAIRTEEDVKNCIDVPVLGVIPSWSADKRDKYYDRYKKYSASGKGGVDKK